jgi:guanine deaminase
MDTKAPDDYDYIEGSAEASIRDTQELIRYIRSLHHGHEQQPLVQPILTPRFALSCSQDLLTRLGSLAASDPTLHIQTHISENETEIIETLKRFTEAKTYADVYHKYGLLRENTILAHAVHLTKDEVELIKQRRVGISHCPTSNFNLNSGIAPIGYYLDRGLKVRLLFSSVLMKYIFHFVISFRLG